MSKTQATAATSVAAPTAANDNPFLARDAQELQTHIEAVLRDFPELADDDELAADTFEGLGLNDFLARAVTASLDAKTMQVAIAERAKDLKARQDRYGKKEAAMRALMFRVMSAAGLPKLTLPEATLSINKGRDKVEVVDETKLAGEYVRTTTAPDKTAIMDAFKAGKVVPGAELRVGEPGLVVRSV
jgi:hypothetical protein